MNQYPSISFDRVLMEGIQDMVFVMNVLPGPVFQYEFLNNTARNHTGIGEAAIGKSLDETLSVEMASSLNKEYRRAMDIGTSITYEDSFLSPNGERFYSETRITPLHNEAGICTHLAAIVKDVTIQKKAQEEVQTSSNLLFQNQQRYQSLFEYNLDAVLSIDLKGRILSKNLAVEKITGYTDKDLIGENFYKYVIPRDIPNAIKGFEHAVKRGAKESQLTIYDKSHNQMEIITKFTPIIMDGETTGIFAIFKDVTLQKQYEEKLKYIALHDPLTDLPNRRLFDARLDYAIEGLVDRQRQFAILMLDIDHFKGINDTMGHDAGDTVIKDFANKLSSCVRNSDVVARFGGDEFIILLELSSGIERTAISLATLIHHKVQEPTHVNGRQIKTTTSIGIAIASKKDITAKGILKQADIALYKAKENGRNTYYIAEKD
ncbi:sensor domain-containing protein [Oceanobacillus manasiensis]|uniref:sensor domain-containing protein n=1 Tax=Oceanobacillus manasiensis TaxID=586413 RepID=UPI00069502BD|nr:sensor domain-containing diguanylate cyclase [Oceanobacillus manasiensis]